MPRLRKRQKPEADAALMRRIGLPRWALWMGGRKPSWGLGERRQFKAKRSYWRWDGPVIWGRTRGISF